MQQELEEPSPWLPRKLKKQTKSSANTWMSLAGSQSQRIDQINPARALLMGIQENPPVPCQAAHGIPGH